MEYNGLRLRFDGYSGGIDTMANRKHIGLLKRDIDAWKKWQRQEEPLMERRVRPGKDCTDDYHFYEIAHPRSVNYNRDDLSDADLSDTRLSRADLRFARLSYANLKAAKLCGACLNRANLYRADLNGALQPHFLNSAIK